MRFVRFTAIALLGTTKQLLWALLYGAIGASAVLVYFGVRYLEGRPELKVWHTAELDEEYSAESAVRSFSDYLALEERLFDQLDRRVYARIAPQDRRLINRYHRGSLADPHIWPVNWNRSFELSVAEPRIGVLLLHGMSDSPYNLRTLGQALHRDGAWVVGLRIPGHGTAPVGLTDVDWRDMAAAVRLAVVHLRARIGERPLYILGYSNGGALAVQYALTTLGDGALPSVQGLILLSPEIGVTKLARFAIWQERLGHVLGMEKLRWNSIQPEYDPYKYGSFALNAGTQAYALTEEIQAQLTQLGSAGQLVRMPRLLAFQSVVDATVTAPALVDSLFDRLPAGPHELVLFDINRFAEAEPLLTDNPTAWLDNMLHTRELAYDITLVTNETVASREVVARRRTHDGGIAPECALDARWPDGVFSLSHVALPFAPDDPLYGGRESEESPGIRLGNVALRGERGVLQIPEADMLRLRWNPFFDYQQQRIWEFLGLAEHSESSC